MGVHYTRQVRRRRLHEHLVDAAIGTLIGAVAAVLLWLGTMWLLYSR